MNRKFTGETQRTRSIFEKMSNSVVVREIHIKTTIRYFVYVTLAKIRNVDNTVLGRVDIGKPYALLEGVVSG